MSGELPKLMAVDIEVIKTAMNGLFIFTAACLVFIMQAGFAILEAGSIRRKNTTNVLIKNWLDACIGAIIYWLVGFGFAFGEGGGAPQFIGASKFALVTEHDGTGTADETDLYRDWFFQFVFAATAATIVSGAAAERCRFEAYLTYSILISGFVYPVVTHWAWTDNGFLKAGIEYTINFNETHNETIKAAYSDFAGSGVVHLTGGCAGFIATVLLGPRLYRFKNGDVEAAEHEFRPHSVPFLALGGFILMFGFLGFNGGSQITIASGGEMAVVFRVVINTVLSGAASGITGLFLMRLPAPLGVGRWSFVYTINATLGGMVAICAGCDAMPFYCAFITGAVASVVYCSWSRLMVRMRADDPVDAVAVHGACGAWGVIARALLGSSDGVFFKWNLQSGLLLAWNIAGIFSIMLWTCLLSLLIFGILKAVGLLRISEEEETIGMDFMKHGEPAYGDLLDQLIPDRVGCDNAAAAIENEQREVKPEQPSCEF